MLTSLILMPMVIGFQAEAPLLSPIFGDHMVLQRGEANTFWGWAKPGQEVTVSVDGKRAKGKANAEGKWSVKLNPPKVGGPYTVVVEGGKRIELSDVLVGDVWICSGQSNMEMGITMTQNASEDIAGANRPNIRLFMVPRTARKEPVETVAGEWKVCTPQTVSTGGWGGFSAAGYFFGAKLQRDLDVPIALIQSAWGGTPAEAWTRAEALRKLGGWDEQLALLNGFDQDKPNANIPSVLVNGMIVPIAPLAIRGAIWYQGESNGSRGFQYRSLLPAMINDWRRMFNQGNFPFYIVSLANFQQRAEAPGDDNWAELREAQWLTTKKVRNTGLAVTIDVGDANDIHPKDKKTVGERLALIALAKEYGKDVVYSGPQYKSMDVQGEEVRLAFDHLGGGLVARGGVLKGFAIAGEDRKWYWANARINGDLVLVRSPYVVKPKAVRYAWATNPEATLFNQAGLPAVPFRTDDWPLLSRDNH